MISSESKKLRRTLLRCLNADANNPFKTEVSIFILGIPSSEQEAKHPCGLIFNTNCSYKLFVIVNISESDKMSPE